MHFHFLDPCPSNLKYGSTVDHDLVTRSFNSDRLLIRDLHKMTLSIFGEPKDHCQFCATDSQWNRKLWWMRGRCGSLRWDEQTQIQPSQWLHSVSPASRALWAPNVRSFEQSSRHDICADHNHFKIIKRIICLFNAALVLLGGSDQHVFKQLHDLKTYLVI